MLTLTCRTITMMRLVDKTTLKDDSRSFGIFRFTHKTFFKNSHEGNIKYLIPLCK